MKNYTFFLLVLLGHFAFAQTIHKSYAPSRFPDRVILGWNSSETATSQSVNWRTDHTVTTAFAEIALADGGPDFAINPKRIAGQTEVLSADNRKVNYHAAHFTDLLPNTQYAYRVGDGEYWSEWFHFTTAKNTSAPFSFLYFGDAQNDLRSMWSRTIRAAYSKLPSVNFMIHAGDLINNANYDFQWGEWFEAGGWLNGMVPSISTPGNHEYFRDSTTNQITVSRHWKPTFVHP